MNTFQSQSEMKTLDFSHWKEVAWNGISFMAPAGWEIGKIGPRYLLLEAESGPLLEVKWKRVRGEFSHTLHLRRLSEFQGKKPGNPLRECSIPMEWQKALGNFQATGFTWQGDTIAGRGVILYCTSCHNATLIQFYQKHPEEIDKVPQPLLTSFRDHRQDGQVIWSVFDILATVPETFQLVRYRFEAGEFRLVFESTGQRITLHRWGPALALLENRNLDQFAGAAFDLSGGALRPLIVKGCNAVQWEAASSRSLLALMNIKPSFRCLRLWHLQEKNRILAVMAEGKGPFESTLLDKICSGYESL